MCNGIFPVRCLNTFSVEEILAPPNIIIFLRELVGMSDDWVLFVDWVDLERACGIAEEC